MKNKIIYLLITLTIILFSCTSKDTDLQHKLDRASQKSKCNVASILDSPQNKDTITFKYNDKTLLQIIVEDERFSSTSR